MKSKKKKKMVNCWPAGLLGPSSWVLLLLEAFKWLCWLKMCLCFYYFSKLLGNFRAKADMTCSPDGTFWALFNKVRADTDLFVLPSHFPLLDMTYHDHGDVFLSIFFFYFFPPFCCLFPCCVPFWPFSLPTTWLVRSLWLSLTAVAERWMSKSDWWTRTWSVWVLLKKRY